MIRILTLGDEARLETYLEDHIETSMFMLSNMRIVGLEDKGERYCATYAAALEGERVVGVVALAWNGMMMVQAPESHLEALARCAWETSGRAVSGMSGPFHQVDCLRAALGLSGRELRLEADEVLFGLDLSALEVPEALSVGAVRCRRAEAADSEALAAWRVAYCMETLGDEEDEGLWASARSGISGAIEERRLWVLEVEGEAVAMTGFNAVLPSCVQVGGVYTPPQRRSRGYGRSAVAGSLLDARAEGVGRSILFTAQDNHPAQAAYRALGYEEVGRFGLVLFKSEAPWEG